MASGDGFNFAPLLFRMRNTSAIINKRGDQIAALLFDDCRDNLAYGHVVLSGNFSDGIPIHPVIDFNCDKVRLCHAASFRLFRIQNSLQHKFIICNRIMADLLELPVLKRQHMNPLIEYINDFLWKEKISQNELARRMEVGKSTMSDVLNERRKITMGFVNKLARVTGDDPGALASRAMGRSVSPSSYTDRILQTVSGLRDEHQIVWDIINLLLKNIDNRTLLQAVLEILKQAGKKPG